MLKPDYPITTGRLLLRPCAESDLDDELVYAMTEDEWRGRPPGSPAGISR